MDILIIDNNLSPAYFGAPNLRRWILNGPASVVHVRRGPDGDLPKTLSDYDCVVISGSRTSALESAPWIDHLHSLIREAIQTKTPMLGVCYGHQAIARAMGGLAHVRKADQPEIGWTALVIETDNPLFRGLDKNIYSFSSHFEEVATLPPGTRCIARSERCAIQGFQVGDLPIFGIQFHPEKSIEDAEYIFRVFTESGRRSLLMGPKESKKRYDAKVPKTLFGNFLTTCAQNSR